MRKFTMILLVSLLMWGCSSSSEPKNEEVNEQEILIELSDEEILINGKKASESVTVTHDIIYYEEGKDETYGEGTKEDAHSEEEAYQHSVVTIKKAGTYRVRGTLSYGQIAVDLGDSAQQDPQSSVTLILDGINLNCSVAPAIIVYNAYECAQTSIESLSKDLDLNDAGFSLVLEEGSVNNISGSYVAEIYQPGTEERLHKYDAAIESLVSLNIKGTGTLNLTAQNEGIETKMHMHIQSGNLNIVSSDDSLNAGADGVSVIRISDGTVVCNANLGQEGDGIDSNGWLIIEGGTVIASANAVSQDSGLDSDNGIILNGGNILATGNMLDQISSESKQHIIVLQSMNPFSDETMLALKQEEEIVSVLKGSADWTVLVYSSSKLEEVDYTLWTVSEAAGNWTGGLLENAESVVLESQLSHRGFQMGEGNFGPMGMMNPDDMGRPEGMERPEGDFDPNQIPEGMERFDGEFDPEQLFEGWSDHDFSQRPQKGADAGQMMDGIEPPDDGFQQIPQNQYESDGTSTNSTIFTLTKNQYYFVIVN